jgi:HK97 family phage portal protein
VDSHPLLDLLAKPNPEQGGGGFMEAYLGYWLLAGNSYVEAVRAGDKPPFELWPLRPDRMTVLPSPSNRIGGYVYKSGGSSVTFKPNEVLHSKFFHPTNDWYGLSPIEAAARAVDRDNAAEAWNTALLQNGARPSGALTTEGELDPQQRADLKDALDDRSRPEAAGRALLLEGGLSWQEMGLTPRDMDWLQSQKWGMKRICNTFGYPVLLADPELGGSFSTDYKEARTALYQDTVLPLMDHARDDLNGWLAPMFDSGLVLAYDPDAVEALQEDRNEAWKRTQDPRMTVDEQREAVGMEPLPNGGGQVIILPVGAQVRAVDALSDADAAYHAGIGDEGDDTTTPGGKGRKAEPWWAEMSEAWMQQTTAHRVKQITDYTRVLVNVTLAKGAEQGHTPALLAQAVRRAYAEMGDQRADVIARSEINCAANAGSRFAALSAGLDLEKEWVSDRGDRHAKMDGQRRAMFDSYDVDGYPGMFPADPDLPAGEAANCRCMEVYHHLRKAHAPERRMELLAEHARYRRAWEHTLAEDARRLFAREGDTVAAAIAGAADTAAASRVTEALPVAHWEALLRTSYRAVMEDFGARTLGELR